ncbi:MAG: hypothetical protein GXX91_17905 [Verrucomicrobiaceae bacterium]|nr:hypothetical protein [Verrucomicrobiaceae bacterium]
MNTRHLPSLPLLGISLLFPLVFLQADEVKLKSGETFTGRITYEADDIIKIEVPVSASIKETKIIGRADIAEIVKDAPDDVEFNRIQGLVPAPSLLPASSYRQLLETGPEAFLKAYPQSAHVSKVEEIRNTLAEELDKVERGFLKIEGEWFSPQDKIDYKALIESRVRFLSMTQLAAADNLNGYIGAMREFETIEKSYYGSPVFPRAVELAREIVPKLGRQLQTLARNVDYRNAEYEQSLANSTPDAREQLVQARAREEKAYQDSLAADKQAGLKWVQLNPRIKASIDDYLSLASSELARINTFDIDALTQQAEKLVEADKLIAQDELEKARSLIAEAAAITGQKVSSTSKSKSRSKSKSKSKGTSGPGSYIAALNTKVNERLAEEKAKADARKAAAESEALTAALNKTTAAESGEDKAEDKPAAEGEDTPAGEAPDGEEPAPDEAKPEAPAVDDFAALAGSGRSSAKADDEEKPSGKKKSKSRKSDDGEEKSKARPAVVVEEEGGFPTHLIVPILTVLLIVTVVLLKVLGIGGKKSEEE